MYGLPVVVWAHRSAVSVSAVVSASALDAAKVAASALRAKINVTFNQPNEHIPGVGQTPFSGMLGI